MTYFTDAGYDEDTEFEVLSDYKTLECGDIVKISSDNGSVHPLFEAKDGRKERMFIPGMLTQNELRVINREEKQEPKIEKEDTWLIGFGDIGQLYESTIKIIDGDVVRVIVDRRPDLSGWWLLSKIQLVKKLKGGE